MVSKQKKRRGKVFEILGHLPCSGPIIDLQFEKMYLLTCVQRRLKTACSFTQSEHNLHCPQVETHYENIPIQID